MIITIKYSMHFGDLRECNCEPILDQVLMSTQAIPSLSEPVAMGSIEIFNHVVSDVDGVTKIIDIALNIFNLLEETVKRIPPSIKELARHFRAFTDLTIFISIFTRIKEWSCADEKGKMLWEQDWQIWATSATFTVSNIGSLLSFLDYLKLIQLGKALPIINIVGSVFSVASSVFDMWNEINKLRKSYSDLTRIDQKRCRWKEWNAKITNNEISKEWKAHVLGKIQKCEQENRKGKAYQLWTTLNRCAEDPNPAVGAQKIKDFYEKKVEYWDQTYDNACINNNKSWVNIAVNVVDIALIIFALLMPVPTVAGLAIALIVFSLGYSVLDLVYYLRDNYWPVKPVQPVPLPVP